MMRSCIIVDDEKSARESLGFHLVKHFADKIKVEASVGSVKEAVEVVNLLHPDLVFLDIEMPIENGFKLFDYFENLDFEVVFVTAYEQYGIKAVKYSALDYLLKPINYIDISDVLNRLELRLSNKIGRRQQFDTLFYNLKNGLDNNPKIAFPTLDGFEMVKLNSIVYCQADGNYTMIRREIGESIMVSKTLKIIEEVLPTDQFYRIHKSTLINVDFVRTFKKVDGLKVVMENGDELDVAVRRSEEFVKILTRGREIEGD